jgi:phage/plasmid-like protein (TIGR03299 family)
MEENMSVITDPSEYSKPADSKVESMFYYGEEPWHKLGVHLQNIATSKEAIVAAGLDWKVQTKKLYINNVEDEKTDNDNQLLQGVFRSIPNARIIQRCTDKQFYGVVGKQYTPIQNEAAFNFFDSVVGQKAAIYHTAGSLYNGRVVWILAKLTEEFGIDGELINMYILLSSSHDGSKALQMLWTPERAVCRNTLRIAISKAIGEKFYARHTPNFQNKVEAAQQILGLTNKFFAKLKEEMEHLSTLQLQAPQMPLLLAAAFGTTDALDANKQLDMTKIWAPTQRAMTIVQNLFEGQGKGLDNPKIKGTKYAAYNAVVEYTQHYREVKDKTEDSRLNSIWFGSGKAINDRALDFLLKM